MSSNIRLQKTCEYCNQTFTAQTTITRYCSHNCNRKHYKQLQRDKKMHTAKTKNVNVKPTPPSNIPNVEREYLSMKEAANHLRVHERTIMNMIKNQKLTSHKIGRRVIIKKESIDKMFYNK